MESLKEYLNRQREERVQKLQEYNDAVAAYEAAKALVDSFGEVADIESEIYQLDLYIEQVDKKEETPAVDENGNIAEDVAAAVEEGGVDEVVTGIEA